MPKLSKPGAFFAVAVLLVAAGCNDGGYKKKVDVAGGTVKGPHGASVTVPAGATGAPVEIEIAENPSDAPAAAQGATYLGAVFAVTPHAITFDQPVTVHLPYDKSKLGPNDVLTVLHAEPGGEWSQLDGYSWTDEAVEVQVSSFSFFVVGVVMAPVQLAPPAISARALDHAFASSGADQFTDPGTYRNPELVSFEVTATGVFDCSTVGGEPAVAALVNLTLSTRPGVHHASYVTTVPWPVSGTASQGTTRIAVPMMVANEFAIPPADWQTNPGLATVTAEARLFGVCAIPGWYTEMHATPSARFVLSSQRSPETLGAVFGPSDVTVSEGTPLTFTVDVLGGLPPPQGGNGYGVALWRQDGPSGMPYDVAVQFEGAGQVDPRYPALNIRQFTFTTPSLAAVDDGALYQVVASSPSVARERPQTAFSGVVHVTVVYPPHITTQPVGAVLYEGDAIALSVAAFGKGGVTYQWLHDGQPVATGPTLSIATAALGDGGRYSVVVTDAAGLSTTSDDVLVVVVPRAPTPQPPTIIAQPVSLTLPAGSEAVFAVSATGTAPLAFQWFKDGTALTGAVGPVLTVPNLTAQDAASYTVTVSNGVNPDATSAAAVLTVTTSTTTAVAPTLSSQPASTSVPAGQQATFSVTATGTPAPSYQWLRNGVALTGATGPSYTTAATVPADDGAVFTVVVSNAGGSVVSNPATLTVLASNALVAYAVVAGYRASWAVAYDGSVWAWGEAVDATTGGFNGSGSSAQWATRPTQVQGLTGVVAVAAARGGVGYGATYALHPDGTVSAWGTNYYGQLGDRTTTDRTAPVKVLDGTQPLDRVCSIAATADALLVVRSDELDGSCGPGKAKRAWVAGLFVGSNAGGAPAPSTSGNGAVLQPVPGLPTGDPVKAVTAGDALYASSALLFLESGAVYAWGWQADNSLGAGASLTVVGVGSMPYGPVDVSAFWGSAEQVELGTGFAVARTGGTLQAVGGDAKGQLGDGATTARPTLAAVGSLSGVTALSVGDATSVAVVNGELWGWGYGYELLPGAVGPNYEITSPTRIDNTGGFANVSVGTTHALALAQGGAVYAWGSPVSGALGNGAISGATVLTPTPVTR